MLLSNMVGQIKSEEEFLGKVMAKISRSWLMAGWQEDCCVRRGGHGPEYPTGLSTA